MRVRPACPRSRSLLLVGLVIAFLPSIAAGQTADDVYRFSTRFSAVGLRASGMSGAGGVGGWADPSALYTNPAGLGYYQASEVSGSLSGLLSRDESTYQIFTDGPASQSTGDNVTARLGHLTGVYNVDTEQGSLVFALGFNRTSAFDRELTYTGRNSASSITDTFLPSGDEFEISEEDGTTTIDVIPIVPFVAFQAGATEFFDSRFQDGQYPFLQAVAPGRSIRQDGTVTRGGSMNELSFAGALEVAPNVMVGGSASLSYGTYAFENELTEIDLDGEDAYSVVAGDGLLEDFQSMLFRERFTSDLTGFNLRLGLSANTVEHLRVGFTVETPTWYSIDETFTDAFIRTEFGNGTLTYGDDSGEDAARGAFDYRLQTPWRLSTGVSYTRAPFLISADVEFVDWSQTSLDADATAFDVANENLEEYDYVVNWRGGVEYRSEDGFSLRGGIAYRPGARGFDFTLADGEETDRSRLFLSAGAGLPLSEHLSVNAAWMQERSEDQFAPYSSVTPPGESAAIDVPVVDEDIVRNQIRVGLRYSF
ncbi:OmpP1/FadL family transporter [Salinibacter altiplanensis]|uniref:OmpP1/FadL family transporter n=1 Tax=Salinibacter altiplanensis TaxID=1803181 RepID=UPI000C9F5AFA|nr:outer membrane protein transport protein [Salinibacter altiplanensis]